MAGILEALRVRAAAAISPTPTAPATPAATTPPAPGGQNGGQQAQQPVDPAAVLTSILAQRPSLVQRFQSDAILFATDQRTARKIFPEAEARCAFKYLTAAVDDALIGGQVIFPKRDAQGEYQEHMGTRVEQVRQEYEDTMPHSLADEAIVALRAGQVPGGQAFTLPATPPAPQAAQNAATQPQGEGGVEMSREDVLKSNERGQQVLLREKQGTNGADASGAANS